MAGRTLSVHLNSPTNILVSVVCRRNRFPSIKPRNSLAFSLSMFATRLCGREDKGLTLVVSARLGLASEEGSSEGDFHSP